MTTGTAGEVPAYQYERGYSLVDDITGDGSAAAADFSMLQWGIYAQDEFQASPDLKVTFGIRMDMPMFLTDAPVDDNFNNNTIPMIEAEGWDLEGAESGKMPASSLMFSPGLDSTGMFQETRSPSSGWCWYLHFPSSPCMARWFLHQQWCCDRWSISQKLHGVIPIYFNPDWDNQYKNPDFGYT